MLPHVWGTQSQNVLLNPQMSNRYDPMAVEWQNESPWTLMDLSDFQDSCLTNCQMNNRRSGISARHRAFDLLYSSPMSYSWWHISQQCWDDIRHTHFWQKFFGVSQCIWNRTLWLSITRNWFRGYEHFHESLPAMMSQHLTSVLGRVFGGKLTHSETVLTFEFRMNWL